MPLRDSTAGLQPSLLDRLIDAEPANRNEASLSATQSLRQLKESLRRDLEWMLNTRRTPEEAPAWARNLRDSLYSFGVADATSMSMTSPEDQHRLTVSIEAAIRKFEPRLMHVSVSMQPVTANSRSLRFLIEGMLDVEPAPERVSFDTTLELTRGEFAVRGQGGWRA